MKHALRISTLILPVAVLLVSSRTAQACTCVREVSPCEEVSGATAIFVGTVIGAPEQKEVLKNDGSTESYDVGSISFEVHEWFVGIKSTEVVIHSGTGGSDCGYWFRRGETYLVYANGDTDDLWTGICSRTRPLSRADQDLAFLRDMPARGLGGTLFGTVNQYAGDAEHGHSSLVGPLIGIRIVIQSGKKKLEVITDRDGRYEVKGLLPGQYKVAIDLPQNLGAWSDTDTADRFGSYSGNQDTRVFDRGCVRKDFFVLSDGRISGRIVDSDGRPVAEQGVVLARAESPEETWSAWSGKDGRFEFRLVQPGRYLLGINLDGPPRSVNPYPRTYYPGVSDPSLASIVGVGDGTKLKGFDMSLPKALIVETLDGLVTWPDGRPVAGALVLAGLENFPGKFPERTTADSAGHFTLKLINGLKYSLWATNGRDRQNFSHSKPVHMIPADQRAKLNLVLTEPGTGFENLFTRRKSNDE